MGWYCHPDTMCISGAHNAAVRVIGKDGDQNSIEYKKAYRKAYAKQNENNFQEGLSDYLGELDEAITWIEEGKSQDEFNKYKEDQYRKAFEKRFGKRK
jgi:soluble cytochrome b562